MVSSATRGAELAATNRELSGGKYRSRRDWIEARRPERIGIIGRSGKDGRLDTLANEAGSGQISLIELAPEEHQPNPS
jgi:hypothetical protein